VLHVHTGHLHDPLLNQLPVPHLNTRHGVRPGPRPTGSGPSTTGCPQPKRRRPRAVLRRCRGSQPWVRGRR
jgi:hypothetical protein